MKTDFFQALKWLQAGKNVRRKSWPNKKFYIYLDKYENDLRADGYAGNSTLSYEELVALDWEIKE